MGLSREPAARQNALDVITNLCLFLLIVMPVYLIATGLIAIFVVALSAILLPLALLNGIKKIILSLCLSIRRYQKKRPCGSQIGG